jgi:hypothetical protein
MVNRVSKRSVWIGGWSVGLVEVQQPQGIRSANLGHVAISSEHSAPALSRGAQVAQHSRFSQSEEQTDKCEKKKQKSRCQVVLRMLFSKYVLAFIHSCCSAELVLVRRVVNLVNVRYNK